MMDFSQHPIGGYSGYLRTYNRMATFPYWEGMRKQIQEYVSKCAICQQNKYEAPSPAGLLQPLPILQQVWEDVSMDFITGLPRSITYNTILVVVDRTKYGHFIPS